MPPTPESTRGWLGVVLPLAERAGPVLSVFLLLLGTLTVWYMLGLLDRAVQRNHALTERLLTVQDAHRQELLRLVHCPPP